MSLPTFRFSNAHHSVSHKLPFGLAVAENISIDVAERAVEQAKPQANENIKKDSERIKRNITCYADFFATHQYECPLPSQFKRTLSKGFPTINPFVDALLICEMSAGVLMGVQDLDRISGSLCYDIANGGESFAGFRGEIRCNKDEIILRDEVDIIASYFQGPDRRTKITQSTTNLVFFGFSAPGIDLSTLDSALHTAVSILTPASGKTEYKIYTPE